ncbi:MAG TPA: DUF1707 domain-containing protein [Streptosporangiaceae bacterium]
MQPSGQPEHPQDAAPRLSPAIRVSDQERDHVAQILQAAFAEGRLDDDEFDERMRAALTARTSADLEALSADLPAAAGRPAGERAAAGRKPGRLAIAYKNSIRRGGRWQVPARFTSVVYKGGGWLDLRAAELTAPATTVFAVAYKSRIDVLVPPGVRVELAGFGVSKGWSEQEELESLLPRDAPVVHVRGVAYKGTIEVSTRPRRSNGAGDGQVGQVTGSVR